LLELRANYSCNTPTLTAEKALKPLAISCES
jgi:hypothetical protein